MREAEAIRRGVDILRWELDTPCDVGQEVGDRKGGTVARTLLLDKPVARTGLVASPWVRDATPGLLRPSVVGLGTETADLGR